MQTFRIPAITNRDSVIDRVAKVLRSLSSAKPWSVTVTEYKPRRSNDQNALLWAMYDQILKIGGETMAGWERNDLHEFFLIEHFGSEEKKIFDRRRLVPLRRSSKLNKQEFSEFVEFILRYMANQGVFVEMPDDYRSAA